MEFRLNKIDSDIIERMQDDFRSDKIHESKEEGAVRKLKSDEHNNFNDGKQNAKKKRPKRMISIDAVKFSNIMVKVEAEKVDMINDEDSKGLNLDAKK